MTEHDHLLRQVSRLTVLAPDERRADRLRARCRAKLAPQPARTAQRPVGPAIFATLCLLYLSAILRDVLYVQGLL